LRYEVKVKFYRDFVKIDGQTILIGLKSKPEKGKANRELIDKLATYFNTSKSQIRIISGSKSKRKVIDIMQK